MSVSFRVTAAIVASLAWTLGGCTHPSREDLEAYVTRDLPGIERYEHTSLQAMRASHHGRQTDADKLKLFKQSLLPLATSYVQATAAVHPATEPVAELHHLKVEAARLQQEAVTDFVTALEKQDANLGQAAGAKFQAYQARLDEFQERLARLEKKVGWAPKGE